jgi:D-sedoheptulose 7-phosphate isomerase
VTGGDLVEAAFAQTIDLHRRVAAERQTAIRRAAEVIGEALARGGRVLVFGNGGSAADAQHFAAELVGRFGRHLERRALGAVALATDGAVMTSVANDFGYDAVFARQIDALGRPGDVALAITTSGASANVNEGLRWALDRSLTTVALTGADGGETGRLADVHVNVPDPSPQRVQEVHITILHVICELVELDARLQDVRLEDD